jgi:hypothetical protein
MSMQSRRLTADGSLPDVTVAVVQWQVANEEAACESSPG